MKTPGPSFGAKVLRWRWVGGRGNEPRSQPSAQQKRSTQSSGAGRHSKTLPGVTVTAQHINN